MKPLHRHVVNTSRKVLCTAALAASLTTAAALTNTPVAGAGEAEPTPESPQAADRGDARLDLPAPLADPLAPPAAGGAVAGEGASGIPATALDAYKRAEVAVKAALPNCNLSWALIAGIGRVESVHASGYGLKPDGTTERPIRGPRLDGNGYAKITDTDKGEWDADTEYDRAFGPLQFIPSTWKDWKADGNGDGQRDANNIYDAALGAGLYLCAGGKDLSLPADLDKAVLSYNSSRDYVNSVLGYMRQYLDGATGVPNPPVGNYPTPPTPSLPTPQAPHVPSPNTPATRPTPTPTPKPTPKPTPTPTPTPTPGEPSKPTPPPATLAKLERVGDAKLEAETGALFAEGVRFKAVLSDGKPAAGQAVVFAVEQDTTGGTGFVFEGEPSVVVRTGADGTATAPRLKAGAKGGTFTLRATAYDAKSQFTVTLPGTVTEKAKPLEITRADGDAPVAVTAGTAVKGLEFLAAMGGKPVADTRVTATLVDGEPGAWVPLDPKKAKGPYFAGKDGAKLFTLELPKTGADGKTALPELLTTDVPEGTYHLRLSTPDGAELVVGIKITAPKPTQPAKPTQAAKP
ncbi:lytic transglycosylase domain-containing protein [Streptomyces sp. NPDC002033]|uniref:lytic transglycosylase domain-containing protein n=1 Tax=unclassified Streptomyces TaxID=2593676 RepID=UPI003325BA6B